MTKISWDDYYAEMAKLISVKSKDQSTNIGAVIVGPDEEIRSSGYNSFPRGLDDYRSHRYERPEKYYWFEHAERNAIYNAARHGCSLKDCKMYLNCYVPCADCARGIIQVGIKEIILGQGHVSSQSKWVDQALRSLYMFRECGVSLRYPNGKNLDLAQMIDDIETGQVYEQLA